MMKSSFRRQPRALVCTHLFRLCSLTALAFACPASAQTTIYATGFENPPFANGSVLTGQDGWVSVGFLNPNAAVISNTAAYTGSQGVRVSGASMVTATEVQTYYDAVGSYRRTVNYDAAANNFPIVRLSADVWLDGAVTAPLDPNNDTSQAASGPFFWANLAARSSAGVPIGEISISSDGHIYGYNGQTLGPNSIQASTVITPGNWYNLALDLDFQNDRYTYLVNGVPIGSAAFLPGANDVLLRGSLVTYTNMISGVRDGYTANFDNFRIGTVVPEPGSLALLAGSLIPGAFWLRRRKR